MDEEQEIELGCVVEDVVTGFSGTVVGVAHYLFDTDEALVVSLLDDKTQPHKLVWFNFPRLRRKVCR